MKLARSTVVAPVPGSEKLLMVQPLTGQVALWEGEDARRVAAVDRGAELPACLPLVDMREAGFAVSSDEEEADLRSAAYAEYVEEVLRTPTQLIVVPSFGCNLKCTYCYQEVFDPTGGGLIAADTIDALFRYVDRFHGEDDPRPYLTLFGGEPLRDTPTHKDRVERILARARARGIGVAVVTNGYDLEAYVPLLSAGGIREVQVTLDGPEPVQDLRRPHASGAGTFQRAERGVDQLLRNGVPVNLRVVADRDNLPSLPALARVAQEHGWLDLPGSLFKTQVGRNYELFGCASGQRRDQLYDRVELWADYVALAEKDPVLRKFHSPRFHGIRHLADTGEFPVANFDACPAAKKEWAFAPDGGLYGCTATVGNPAYRLGTYAPEVVRDETAIGRWRERSVFTIEKCKDCSVAAVCGGGCGAIAANRTGDIRGADCRPVAELFGIGARFYGLG
ncbi:MAG: radical SAM protein [Deltaproteobacteria bacterium]|nr:radical SAM protein [Deltaproteobacteria bacterium]